MINNGNFNSPFLRTSRNFPEDLRQLAIEVDKAYIDIANNVNARTISIFPITRPIGTGEAWFFDRNLKHQTFRQIYTFTAAGNIPHGINVSKIYGFSKIYGTFTDGSVWYPLPYVDVVNSNNQVGISVTSTNIVIAAGAGTPPTITQGFVILEWLSQV